MQGRKCVILEREERERREAIERRECWKFSKVLKKYTKKLKYYRKKKLNKLIRQKRNGENRK